GVGVGDLDTLDSQDREGVSIGHRGVVYEGDIDRRVGRQVVERVRCVAIVPGRRHVEVVRRGNVVRLGPSNRRRVDGGHQGAAREEDDHCNYDPAPRAHVASRTFGLSLRWEPPRIIPSWARRTAAHHGYKQVTSQADSPAQRSNPGWVPADGLTGVLADPTPGFVRRSVLGQERFKPETGAVSVAGRGGATTRTARARARKGR